MFSGLIIIVDLEGVEPSSKQGSHMLSTCLSLPSVFVHKQDQSHNFISVAERDQNYFRICCTAKPNASEQELLSDVSFPSL